MVSSREPDNHGYINQGEHQGDVYFGQRSAPPPYHKKALDCHQCEQPTWRNTPDCVHCGADIRGDLECRDLKREISYTNYRTERLSLWLICSAIVILVAVWLNVMWLMVVAFILCAVPSAIIGKLQQRREVFRKRLYQFD